MKITFYYVRHGKTLFNETGRMQGQCDSPLTAEGIEQAEDIASALRKVHFDGVYCSSSERAYDTADIIARLHNIGPVPMKELKEFDFGDLDGQLFKDMNERIQSHRIADDWTDVHGENVELFEKRTTPAFERIANSYADGSRILIVSHGSFFMHLMKTLLQYDQQDYIKRMNQMKRAWVPNCSMSIFSYEDGRWTLEEEPMTADEYRQKHDPKTIHFYLMRHGETVFNVERRVQGWCDSPLTEAGIRQAKEAGRRLSGVHFDRVYTSTSERARDTAALVTSRKAVNDKRLREVFYGTLEGQKYEPIFDQIMQRHIQVHYKDLGGEERTDVEKRIHSFFRDVIDQAEDNNTILLVSHGDYYFTLMETLFHIPRQTLYDRAESEHRNPTPNCGIARFDYVNQTYKLIHTMK